MIFEACFFFWSKLRFRKTMKECKDSFSLNQNEGLGESHCGDTGILTVHILCDDYSRYGNYNHGTLRNTN